MNSRLETDLLGDLEVPRHSYYGIHTQRAKLNFPITGQSLANYPTLIRALGAVKEAAALANVSAGVIPPAIGEAIAQGARDVQSGMLDGSFVVDPIQGGAGTSTNMNANEVIANRALELLNQEFGDYAEVHPLNHVNASQSTNDVYPTAGRIAIAWMLLDLRKTMQALENELRAKALEFRDVVKIGRTQLQEAVPMTLGREFHAYATMVSEDLDRISETIALLCEVNLGGTAIGTGVNASDGYRDLVVTNLAAIVGLPLTPSVDLIEATQDVGAMVHASSTLKRIAVKVSKICNDLRLLSSGPNAGFAEISLPPVQAGSSIMPGKVNPVIPEVVNQVAFEVVGNDVTVSMAAEAGQLQLNAFEPIIIKSIADSITHLDNALQVLATRCIPGITTNPLKLRNVVESSVGLVTELSPILGYKNATALVKLALSTGESVRLLAQRDFGLSEEDVQRVFSQALTNAASR
jgi:aspartate ammonia-lyase